MTLVTRPKFARPTEGEVKVLDLLIAGYSNEAIGHKLQLATHTVKTHIKRASVDVGARSRTHLAVIYATWKYGHWEYPKWDARRREHSNACNIFKDETCDCQERRNPPEDRRIRSG